MSEATHATEPEAFSAELSPCLALASGVSMGRDDRRAWLNAAWKAIGHYPLDVLKAGTAVAMREADHPSKIIPIITRVAEPILSQQRSVTRMVDGARTQALPAPGGERATKAELDAICREYGVGRYAKTEAVPGRPRSLSLDPARECRAPTRADYLCMGVAAEALDGMGIA